ncbi:glycine/sarcosine/betaine reductase selenoprotein B family protein [Thermodesulfobacteriota bacterium]
MGNLSEFPLKYRLFLKAYPWRRIDPVPWTPLKKTLKDSRLVLVSSAGLVTADQEPFDDSIRGGDPSFREIPFDADVATLLETHRSDAFDHTGIRQDPNLAFPADRLREMAAAGLIGSLNHRYLSMMGSITAPGRLIKKTIPQVVPKLIEDRIDIALLVPV